MRQSSFTFRATAALTASLVICTLFAAQSAQAQTNPPKPLPSVAPKWVASIIISKSSGPFGCSGAVVGNGWVLTAAHCVSDDNTRALVSANSVKITLGKAANTPGTSSVADEVRVPDGYSISLPGTDIALLHLKTFDKNLWQALPLALEADVIDSPGSSATFYGYGRMSYFDPAHPTSSPPAPLQMSGANAYHRELTCDGQAVDQNNGHVPPGDICYAPGSNRKRADSLTLGDSGSAALVFRYGSYQIAGVATHVVFFPQQSTPATPVGATSILGHGLRSEGFETVREWVAEYAGIPNTNDLVVRNGKGQSWLVGSDGYRKLIGTTKIYNCLMASHYSLTYDQIVIDTIPDRIGARATCP